MKRFAHFFLSALLFAGLSACSSQRQGSAPDQELNDSNTPLHLLQPAYKVTYGVISADDVKADIDRVLAYLQQCTPAQLEITSTGETLTDYSTISSDTQIRRGTFRLASYEWGVTYSAMIDAADATADKAYFDYAADRFKFIAQVAPAFRQLIDEGQNVDPQMTQILAPQALDDAGAVCTAMIKAMILDPSLDLKPLVDNYMDFILNKEYRLTDGTFARKRPQYNTVWLDDMFMGIPPLAYYSKLPQPNSDKYLSEAVRQVLQFAERMWVPEKKLFRHGWVEQMADHPAFHWGRANGWALLTMSEVLDVLPDNYLGRDKILALFREHVRGLAPLQSSEGLWHQLLDRPDTYLETSATAIYVYCFAHAINKGWIDPLAYGPVALLGWHGVASQINQLGQVDGTCVGTGMAFDPAYYSYRPVNVYAAHGYGPVIWAGAEMIRLLNSQHPKMNDSAVQFYREPQNTNEPIFAVQY